MASSNIRRASAADTLFLREMLFEALYVPPGSPPYPRSVLDDPAIAHYCDAFGTRPGDRGLIAESTPGEPIGAAWIRVFGPEDPGYGFVDDETPELSVAVTQEHRGRGIGSALLVDLLEGNARCCLSTDRRNPAVRLYRRLGFTTTASDGHTLTMLRTAAPPGESADQSSQVS